MRRLAALSAFMLLCVTFGSAARAAVTGVEITRREPFAGGRSFGSAGAYEIVAGRASFAVDPKAPGNARIADLALAPCDASGRVDFASDFVIVRPVDRAKARPAVLLEVLNRGSSEAKYFFYGPEHRRGFDLPGLKDQELHDTFLFERGFTLAFLGWETHPDHGSMRLYAPQVDVTGRVRGAIVTSAADVHASKLAFDSPAGDCPLDATQPTRQLAVKRSFDDPGTRIAAPAWHFATTQDAQTGGTSCAIALGIPVIANRLYEVTFEGGKTAVAGLGFAAMRDFATYLKRPDAAAPLSSASMPRVLGFGYSQSARYLRDFLREGFNASEGGGRAFDGLFIASAGAGIGSFNQRYAMTGEAGTSVLSDLRPVDRFPFTDGDETDPVTGEHGGLLAATLASDSMPKIVTTLSSVEYWARFASLTYTSVDGRMELPLDPNARLYFITGTPHGIGAFPPSSTLNDTKTQNDLNFAVPTPAFHALLLDLDAWVANGTAPPASQYPHLPDLVPHAAVRFPAIAGSPFPAYAPRTWRMDFGPRFDALGIADDEPPKLGAPYVTLVPQVDADGNDRGGIALPFLAVPLGTYTGWNVELPQDLVSFDYLSGLYGSFIPFARDANDRAEHHDARASIAERYASRETYLDRTRASAEALVARRFFLREDVEAQVRSAGKLWDAVVTPAAETSPPTPR